MKRIALVANLEKEGALRAAEQVRGWAALHHVEVVTNLDAPPDPCLGGARILELRQRFSGCDLAVTLGGDGTLLYGVHIVAPLGIPVLAVNLGSLGFHTQVDPAMLLASLDAVASGEYRPEMRLMLQATLESVDETLRGQGEPNTMLALNDVVVSRGALGHMVRLRVSIGGHVLTDLFADGLIVATPTGSSAYNYAADGPILQPGLDAMVLNAVCPHRMKVAPLVVSPDSEILIEFHARKPREEAQLLVDGRQWCATSHDQRLKISRAPMYLPLVTFNSSFFEKLRNKLAWGGLI